MQIQIPTPKWAVPLLEPRRYKGAKGGRGSGKSHFFAEQCVERLIYEPDARIVCIREIQKSLKYSAKSLIEGKIQSLGVGHLFEVLTTEIKAVNGNGLIIFQGMQDHTADSIKSLEGFDIAWVEESQSLSKRSLDLLRPTIRKDGSELWFSWNPENKDDAVDDFMLSGIGDDDFCLVHVNSDDNPWLPDVLKAERERDRRERPNDFGYIWLGEYNTKSDAQIFRGKWQVAEFEPLDDWDGPYFGLDFGFANDPTAAVRCWIADNRLYIDYEAGKVGLELDDTSEYLSQIPQLTSHTVRADSARPESISYLKRKGIPLIKGVEKGKGSVEDGIEFLKSFEKIVIHSRCEKVQEEARLYSYKIDKRSGDIMNKIEDKHNHYFDAIRYALEPIMKNSVNKKRFEAMAS